MFLLVPAYPGCPGSKAVKRSGRGCFFCKFSIGSGMLARCHVRKVCEAFCRHIGTDGNLHIVLSTVQLPSPALSSLASRDVASVSAPCSRGVPMPRLGLVGQRMCLGLDRLSASCTFLGLPAATIRNEMTYSTVTYKQYGVK